MSEFEFETLEDLNVWLLAQDDGSAFRMMGLLENGKIGLDRYVEPNDSELADE